MAGTSSPRLTAKQAVMIGVLGLALVGVVVYGQPEAEAVAPTPEPVAAPVARPAARQNVKKKTWAKVSLDEALRTNPFADLAAPEAPATVETGPVEDEPAVDVEALANAAKARNAAIEDLRSQKVSLILRHSGKTTAMIGNRMVREGDVLNGFRVVSILPTGVVFEPLPSE